MNGPIATTRTLASRGARIAGASAAAILSMAILTGLGPILQDFGLPGPTVADAAAGPHLIITAAELARLPTSGTAWRSMKAAADSNAGTPDLSNQDSNNDVLVLAKAFVYARTKILAYRSAVLSNLRAVVGTEAGGRTLAAARGIPSYVIAADLIGLSAYDPAFDTRTFRPWLRRLLTENLQGDTIISTQETRPNNWGTHAGAARAAIAIYLGDRVQLARTARVFKGFLGDRASYAGFSYGDLTWQCNARAPVGINPTPCVKNGISVGGAIPDEMRRGASLEWPPATTDYPWELMQGAVVEAELLTRAGYPAWTWQNRALLRAAQFLYSRAGWPADSNDDWQPWLLDYRYGATFARTSPTHVGKNFAWTDWLHGAKGATSSNGWVTYGDTSSLVTYHGSWFRLSAIRDIGRSAHASRRGVSRAVFKFYGNEAVWIGSKGPTQGKAAVYLDGKLVRIIDLHTAVRHYRVKLYTVTLSKVGLHYLTIKVLGSPGHPTVVVDGFLVHR